MKIISGSKSDKASRQTNGERSWEKADKKGTLLKPNELGYDTDIETLLNRLNTKKGLSTPTLTRDDLYSIQREVNKLGNLFVRGIKAKQVINKSLHVDRVRSNNQIKWAICSGYRDNVFTFVTDASRQYRDTRHYVTVEFMDFHSALGMPNRQKACEKVLKGRLKFDCDCGRHTYWYRYIATIGGYAYVGGSSRPETAFPKIRNSAMDGIACKHVLRTMQTILTDGQFKKMMLTAIKKRQKNPMDNKVAISESQAKIIVSQSKNKQEILSTGEHFSPSRLKAKLSSVMKNRNAMLKTNNIQELQKRNAIDGSLFGKLMNRLNKR